MMMEAGCKFESIPPTFHWSIVGSQQPCSRWSVAHLRRGECREMGR